MITVIVLIRVAILQIGLKPLKCSRLDVTDWLRGGRLGVTLYSRIAIRVANSNIVPFLASWPSG